MSYCNRCGAKVLGAEANGANKPAELSPNVLVIAIAAVFVFGLTAIFGLMALMKGGTDPIILAAAMLSFLLTLLVEVVLIWLLLSGRRSAKEKEVAATERLKEHTTKELVEAQARALPEPLPSVTEHTTRTLDPVYGERKSK